MTPETDSRSERDPVHPETVARICYKPHPPNSDIHELVRLVEALVLPDEVDAYQAEEMAEHIRAALTNPDP